MILCLTIVGIATASSQLTTATHENAPIVVTVSATSVIATGIDPHGEALVFARTIEDVRGVPRLEGGPVRVRDADGDGSITLPVSEAPHRGVWVVIDVETGRYGTGWRGSPPKTTFFPRHQLKQDDGEFEISRLLIEVLYMRPKGGAWTAIVREGGPLDADGRPSSWIRVRISSLKPVEDSGPAPTKIKNRDVLVVIDPRTLQVYASEAQ